MTTQHATDSNGLAHWSLYTTEGGELGVGWQATASKAREHAQAEADRLGVAVELATVGSGKGEVIEPSNIIVRDGVRVRCSVERGPRGGQRKLYQDARAHPSWGYWHSTVREAIAAGPSGVMSADAARPL